MLVTAGMLKLSVPTAGLSVLALQIDLHMICVLTL